MFNLKKFTLVATTVLSAFVASVQASANASSAARHTASISSSTVAPGAALSRPYSDTNDFIASPFTAIHTASTTKAALAFVRQTGLNKNLSLLLLETMKKDGTVLSAIKKQGFESVKDIVVGAIIIERTAQEEAWNKVLADVYSNYFNASELLSLAELKEKSPYFSRLISLQNEITTKINENGSSLLEIAERNVKSRVAAALGA